MRKTVELVRTEASVIDYNLQPALSPYSNSSPDLAELLLLLVNMVFVDKLLIPRLILSSQLFPILREKLFNSLSGSRA